MGSDGDDVGSPLVLPESRTESRLRSLEDDRERMERDVSALRQDLLRVATRASEHERQTNERVDRFGEDVQKMIGPVLERIDRRNELLAKLCDHTMRVGGALGEAPVKVLREVRQSMLLSAGFAVLTIAASAALLGLDVTEIMFGENYGVKFVQKPGNEGAADYGEPVKGETPQP